MVGLVVTFGSFYKLCEKVLDFAFSTVGHIGTVIVVINREVFRRDESVRLEGFIVSAAVLQELRCLVFTE